MPWAQADSRNIVNYILLRYDVPEKCCEARLVICAESPWPPRGTQGPEGRELHPQGSKRPFVSPLATPSTRPDNIIPLVSTLLKRSTCTYVWHFMSLPSLSALYDKTKHPSRVYLTIFTKTDSQLNRCQLALIKLFLALLNKIRSLEQS